MTRRRALFWLPLFSEGDLSFVDLAQHFAGLGSDREVGLTFGKELAQVGKKHLTGRVPNPESRIQTIFSGPGLSEPGNGIDDGDAGLVDGGDVDLIGEGNGSEDFGDGGTGFFGRFFSFAKGKNGGTGTTDAEAEGPGGNGGALGLVELGDQFLTAGLGDDVVNGATDQPVIGLNEPADQTAEVTDLGGGVGEGDFFGKDFAGDLGEDLDIGMNHGGPEVLGDGKFGDVEFGIVAHEDDAPEEGRSHVVSVPGPVGGSFPGHGEGEQLFLGKRGADEGVDGEGSRDGGGCRRAEARAEGHAFVDLHLDTEVAFAQMVEKVEGGDSGGVFGRFGGQLSLVAGDGGDAEAGFVGVASDDVVPGRIDGKTEHVIATSDVGDGGGGEDDDFGWWAGLGHGHSLAGTSVGDNGTNWERAVG